MENGYMDVCLACYWNRVDDNVFETFCRTFRRHNKHALLQVHTNSIPQLQQDYGIEWFEHDSREIRGRRALRKLEIVAETLKARALHDRLMVADVDLYFLRNPFEAFDEQDFDIAVTCRPYLYWAKVNGGVWFVKKNLEFLLTCVNVAGVVTAMPKWCEDVKNTMFARTSPQWPDWFIDQDALRLIWAEQKNIRWANIRCADVSYNFCPGADVYGLDLARQLMQIHYRGRRSHVLHLKGKMKQFIYEGWLEDAVTIHPKGGSDWQHGGE